MTQELAINGGKPVRDKLLPYGHQWIDEEDIKTVVEVLRSDWITQGPKVVEFEKEFAKHVGARYAVAVNSGTAALHAACFAANIEKGDEVITSPITFVASANCVIYQGGIPVFADIKEDTLNINPEEIKKKINQKTKALIPVDFTGLPVDLEEIQEIARKYNLIIIEDASHALGATYKGSKIGSISDMTIFSFHPVKHIATGEGGMITTNNKEYYERLILFRTHGITKERDKLLNYEGPWYYEMQELGYNYRLTDFQCALGLSQLKKIDRIIQRRREIVQKYNYGFKDMPEIKIPEKNPFDSNPAWHVYMIQLNLERIKVGRREIFEALRAENIGVNVHYIPVHLQPYYQKRFGYHPGDFPKAENYYSRAITLPIFPKMTEKDINDVVKAVKKVINYYKC
ncbi:UDP-4-amino-4,6-dideoxy-N-acetyl-beta-L-altrosamine transaminase [Candidatus Atribacteria bacterium MT.SAG.1]|nr:UDP-4-amino-4,6-dideoxy-N-acetyl-beta-L-altrosamine transaminase [Candidatus Atribacteria bacterium MT.SAG.1]